MITAATRRCKVCRDLLPEGPEAVAVCARCGILAVPPHATWERSLKFWIMWQHARAKFVPWRTEQETWEMLMRDTLNGTLVGSARPNPHRFSLSTPAATLWPVVLQLHAEWRELGAPIDAFPPVVLGGANA